jgi:hypothetical protein
MLGCPKDWIRTHNGAYAPLWFWEIMMGDKDKTKAHLINELMELRQRLIQLEKSEYECQRTAEEIHRSYQIQSVLNKLLFISLKTGLL